MTDWRYNCLILSLDFIFPTMWEFVYTLESGEFLKNAVQKRVLVQCKCEFSHTSYLKILPQYILRALKRGKTVLKCAFQYELWFRDFLNTRNLYHVNFYRVYFFEIETNNDEKDQLLRYFVCQQAYYFSTSRRALVLHEYC